MAGTNFRGGVRRVLLTMACCCWEAEPLDGRGWKRGLCKAGHGTRYNDNEGPSRPNLAWMAMMMMMMMPRQRSRKQRKHLGWGSDFPLSTAVWRIHPALK
jgi:hypothetical protein